MLTSIALGVLVGMVLGLTGAGGGILAVPALLAGTGWTPQQAAPVALIAVAAAAAIGSIEGLRRGLVRYKAASLMGLASVPFTACGLRVAQQLPQSFLLVLFALVMLVVAARLLAPANRRHARDGDVEGDGPEPSVRRARIHAATGRLVWNWPTALMLSAVGASSGFLSGLLGVGGGFVVVPMLKRFTDIPMHGIVATSLLLVALVSSGGVANAWAHGAQFPWAVTSGFLAAMAAGMLVARRAAGHLPPAQVQRSFACLLVMVAFGLLLKAAR